LWNIATKYGIPDKIINIMKSFYHGSRCAQRVDGVLREFFEIRSGVKTQTFRRSVTTSFWYSHGLDSETSVGDRAGIEWRQGKAK